MTGEFFRGMLNSPEIGASQDGSLDHPIKLANISAFEMDCFTTLLNTRIFESNPNFTYEQWGAALHLSTLWDFTVVREYITEKMTAVVDKMDILDRIKAGDKFGVANWLVTAFVELCTRATSLTCEELEGLGGRRSAALCRIREQRLKVYRTRSGVDVREACTMWVKETSVLKPTGM
ncbi:hypothetical protein FRB99_003854 [Tulasnella sp. 403]|nr:hypothetical protein FRB99_003854 [Tulasnella sp. 403]